MEVQEFKKLVKKEVETFNSFVNDHIELNKEAFKHFTDALKDSETNDSDKLHRVFAYICMLDLTRHLVKVSIDKLIEVTDNPQAKDLNKFARGIFCKKLDDHNIAYKN